MPCHEAMINDVIIAHPDQTVEDVMEILEKHGIRCVPIVNEKKQLLGIFSSHKLLESLLPVSVTMEDGLSRLNFLVGAAPGVAKRLHKMKPQKISKFMETDVVVASPETPTWEILRLLVKYGSPLPIVEEETGIIVGLVSEQSAIEGLERMIEDIEEAAKAKTL